MQKYAHRSEPVTLWIHSIMPLMIYQFKSHPGPSGNSSQWLLLLLLLLLLQWHHDASSLTRCQGMKGWSKSLIAFFGNQLFWTQPTGSNKGQSRPWHEWMIPDSKLKKRIIAWGPNFFTGPISLDPSNLKHPPWQQQCGTFVWNQPWHHRWREDAVKIQRKLGYLDFRFSHCIIFYVS